MKGSSREKISKYMAYLHRSNHCYVGKRLKKYDLKNTTFPILLNLNEHEVNTVNQIAREINVDKSIISRGVKDLLKYEYIVTTPSLKNKSSFSISLTKKGRDVIPKIYDVLDTWESTVFRDLEEGKEEEIVRLLKQALKYSKDII